MSRNKRCPRCRKKNCPGHKSLNLPSWAIVPLTLLGVVLLGLLLQNDEVQPEAVSARELSSSQEMAILSDFNFPAGTLEELGVDRQDAVNVLGEVRKIIEDHPHPAVKIVEGWLNGGGMTIGVNLHSDSFHHYASVGFDLEGGLPGVLTLDISVQAIREHQPSKSQLEQILLHESVHALDLIFSINEGKISEEHRTVREEDLVKTERYRRESYEMELRAYKINCDYAIQIRAEDDFSICRAYASGGDEALRRHFVNDSVCKKEGDASENCIAYRKFLQEDSGEPIELFWEFVKTPI